MPEASILITAKDNYSTTINNIRNTTRAFNKDVDGLQDQLNTLSQTKATLTVDFTAAKRELKEATDAFRKLGDAQDDEGRKKKTAAEDRLKNAVAECDNLKNSLARVTKEANDAAKAMDDYADGEMRKENRVGGVGGTGGAGGIGGNGADGISRLAGAGLGKQFGDAVAGALQVGVSSTLGEQTGSAISTAISGALTGAAMGSIAGPVGAAVGGAVGLVSGSIAAGTEYFAKEDDSFKSYYQDQYNTIENSRGATLESGSAIAAQRETSLQSFSTLLGDEDTAKNYLDEMKTMANTTPFLYDDLAQISKTLLTYGYKEDELIPQMTVVGDAGAALGLGAMDMSMISTGIGRMKSSDKASLEYINILQERGVDAIGYLASAKSADLGRTVTNGEIYEMISKSEIKGSYAVDAITAGMKASYAGAMEAQGETFAGKSSTLQGMEEELQNAMGEGYNNRRKEGMDAQINYLSGESGEQMQEVNRMMGAYQAGLENLKEQYAREALDAVMTGKVSDSFDDKEALELKEWAASFQEAQASGDEMAGRYLEMAEALAANAYNADDRVQEQVDTQLDMLNELRNSASLDEKYYDESLRIGDEISKGLAAARREMLPILGAITKIDPKDVDEFDDTVNRSLLEGAEGKAADGFLKSAKVPDSKPPLWIGGDNSWKNSDGGPRHAFGLLRVPRDDYIARLHEGERVLTAQESRAYNSNVPTVTITGNTFTIREEADIDKIARYLAEELRKAQLIT